MRQKLQHWTLILIYGAILWLTSISQAEASSELSEPGIRHVLERLSFGINSEQIHQVKTEGIEAYIQSQLNPELVREYPLLDNYLSKLDSIQQHPLKLQQDLAAKRKKIRKLNLSLQQRQQMEREIQEFNTRARDEAMGKHLARVIYSNRQLQEVMVDFWFNHFNVFAAKGSVNFWVSDYENEIRHHALGNFRDLLEMTASHPAMLIYLDNQLNTAPNSPGARGQYRGLNENYARELMELHTLGVEGGYSQDDVIALARIFTGWTVDHQGKQGNEKGFYFNNNRHDQEKKIFLGHKITAKGIEEGQEALDILASHPATAHFISYKLAQYFVADQPPSNLVDSLAETFLDSKGNIKVVMDTLIYSPEFNSPEYYQQKFTTPLQYIVSLVRMGEIQHPNLKRIRGMLSQLSMPLYLCVPPTGYRNTQDAWVNPQAMLQRIGLATAIANGRLNRDYSLQYKQLENNVGDLSPHTKQVIAKSPPGLHSALILGSPEAMYH